MMLSRQHLEWSIKSLKIKYIKIFFEAENLHLDDLKGQARTGVVRSVTLK